MIQKFMIQPIMLVEYRMTSLGYRDGQICGIYILMLLNTKRKILHIIGKSNKKIDYKMKLSEDNYDNIRGEGSRCYF